MTDANKVLFLDRDGTLIVEKNYLSDPDLVELCEEAIKGLRLFQQMDFRIVVVTNQSGIGRGYYSEEAMHCVHGRISEILALNEIGISQYLYCPHHPDERCNCRKPQIEILKEVDNYEQIDWERSIMVGDKRCDMEFGRNAGLTSVLVTTGYGDSYDHQKSPVPSTVVSNLLEAAQWVERVV